MRSLIAVVLLCGAGAATAHAQNVIVDGSGAEIVGGSAQVLAVDGAQVKAGGVLTVGGTAASPANWQGPGSISVLSGGLIDFKFARFENLSTLTVATGGKIARIHDTVFTDLAGYSTTAAWIDLAGLASGDRQNLPFSFNRVTFSDGQTPFDRVNIKSSAATPMVRMLGNSASHGNQWGESFDDDSAGKVAWHSGGVTRTLPSGTFDTLEEGIKASGTDANSVFTVTLGAMSFVDDFVDINTSPGGAGANGPTVKNACLAPMSGAAVSDGDGDSDFRGVLINCIVARGAVSETKLLNCTLFDSNAALSVNNIGSGSNNNLIENDFTGSGNSFGSNSLTTAVNTFFSSPSDYNFHLASPGGDTAIDEGAVLAEPFDLDGEPRGFNGKPGTQQPGEWDIGADEATRPSITTVTHKTRDDKPIIRGTGTVGATVAIFRNGQFIGTAVVLGDGTWSFEDPIAQGSGTYTYSSAYYYGSGSYGLVTITNPAITVDLDHPAAPTNVRVTNYSNCCDVEWTRSVSTDVAGYKVWRKTMPSGTWTCLNETSLVLNTKFRDDTVTNGTSYQYKVVAVDDALEE